MREIGLFTRSGSLQELTSSKVSLLANITARSGSQIKAGHFTNTFSLQLLAITKTIHESSKAPLVIFTRPPDVYKYRSWFATTSTDVAFSSITDCLVVPGSKGQLNRVLVSSAEGVSLAWYHEQRWHCEALLFTGSEIARPTRMSFVQSNDDLSGLLAIAEVILPFQGRPSSY